MENKVRFVLGISGGKDSTALAIYLKNKYPQFAIDYYFCDTGKELDETYQLLEGLEIFLGQKITRLRAAEGSPEDSFDHFLTMYGGFLPSSNARWCTSKLKLEPFEKFVGDVPTVSFVAIRGDENREAYISKKDNIQSIFPFRRKIWSEDVISKVLHNASREQIADYYRRCDNLGALTLENVLKTVSRVISPEYPQDRKLNDLMDFGLRSFNDVVFRFLKSTNYPLAGVREFPLVDNEDVVTIDGVFRILEESGVGVPKYYEKFEYQADAGKGYTSRSRSGCYFCFFQQKIEWVWLYERHNDLFLKAMEYEKDGYTWMQGERLIDLIKPERIRQIKEDQVKRIQRGNSKKSEYLVDLIEDAEGEGCAACFI